MQPHAISKYLRKLKIEVQIRRLLNSHRSAPKILQFDIFRQHVGFFAELNYVLFACQYAEGLQLFPLVNLRSDTYRNSSNSEWFGQIFERKGVPSSAGGILKLNVYDELKLPFSKGRIGPVSISRAHQTFDKYFCVSKTILDKVEGLITRIGCPYVAMHFRGTDKKKEAPSVSLQTLQAIFSRLRSEFHPNVSKVYVATDEAYIIEKLGKNFGGFEVFFREEVTRSNYGNAIHTNLVEPDNRYRIGEEALIDCLMLSRSQFLVRTASFLSGWASIFCPTMPFIMVNRPYEATTWFPDSHLLAKSQKHRNTLNIHGF